MVIQMKSIINNSSYELIVKNSRFISLIYKFYDGDDLNKYLDEAKEKYPKATHYTFGYITESSKKSSDDGEPGGTAGMPILNVLEKEEIINVLVIIVRYFGGIKLSLLNASLQALEYALTNPPAPNLIPPK